MKNFADWGLRIRKNEELNYYALWFNLETTRLDLGKEIPLQLERSEFLDIGLGTKCNLNCSFCYVSATKEGEFYPNVSEVWKKWMSTFPEDIKIDPDNLPEDDEILKEIFGKPDKGEGLDELETRVMAQMVKKFKKPIVYTQKPFQIAIGSTMEPTIHPEFVKFLETVYNTGVVPNYTTNGLTLSDYNDPLCRELLEATSKYCGGVAVSYGNKSVRTQARAAVENLIEHGNCKVVIHHLISDKASVEEMIELAKEYKDRLHYHVLLPLMEHGRSKKGLEEGVFEYMGERTKEEGIRNLAFGANFAPQLKSHPDVFNVYEYPQETYSKNALLKDGKVVITPSSFNLEPIMEISL